MKKDCWKWKRDQSTHKGHDDGGAVNVVDAQPDEQGQDLLLDHEDAINVVEDIQADWMLDSGANVHYTSLHEVFATYSLGDFGEAKMADGGSVQIIGMGDVHL